MRPIRLMRASFHDNAALILVAGGIAARMAPFLTPGRDTIYQCAPMLFISARAFILTSLKTPPHDDKILVDLKRTVRGFWKSVLQKLQGFDPQAKTNPDFGRDVFNVVNSVS